MKNGAELPLPIGSINFSIEKWDVRDEVLLIVRREHIRDGYYIGHVRIKRRLWRWNPSPTVTIAIESGVRMADSDVE